MIIKSYTYHLYWSATDTHYYGVRWAKNCDPADLWVSYFTSSKYVKDYAKRYGDPDVIEVRKTFDSVNAGRAWEHRVLTRLRVSKRTNYLNVSSGSAKFYVDISSDEHLAHRGKRIKLALNKPEVKQKRSRAIRDALNTPEAIAKRNREELKQAQRERGSRTMKLMRPKQFGTNASNHDKTLYVFLHNDGRMEISTQYAFKQKYKFSNGKISELVNQVRRSHKGWKTILYDL